MPRNFPEDLEGKERMPGIEAFIKIIAKLFARPSTASTSFIFREIAIVASESPS